MVALSALRPPAYPTSIEVGDREEDIVIRERVHIVARDRSGLNHLLETVASCNRLCGERDWPTATAWTFVAGRMNELLMETDYADLAGFQRVHEEQHDDGGWQILTKPLADALVDERSYTELLARVETAE